MSLGKAVPRERIGRQQHAHVDHERVAEAYPLVGEGEDDEVDGVLQVASHGHGNVRAVAHGIGVLGHREAQAGARGLDHVRKGLLAPYEEIRVEGQGVLGPHELAALQEHPGVRAQEGDRHCKREQRIVPGLRVSVHVLPEALLFHAPILHVNHAVNARRARPVSRTRSRTERLEQSGILGKTN